MSQLLSLEKSIEGVPENERSLPVRNTKTSDKPGMKSFKQHEVRRFGVGGKVGEIRNASGGGGTTIVLCCSCSGSAFYKDVEAFHPKKS
ncbi:hypothetical protein M3N64_06485 [Sporolactobacillus sp. CPB3-1]|uniref:Uncharacterized protein n=1 Tax=Sporolactobacillus mangiferae TaxID=2940498 RepID=A0ABT0M9P7_9BACL|nr:hypothetical protein [Sporolactobacillus mangiferae]MCL1631595.1 hypothetical protein [Sporolactobacillus mangiferae]